MSSNNHNNNNNSKIKTNHKFQEKSLQILVRTIYDGETMRSNKQQSNIA